MQNHNSICTVAVVIMMCEVITLIVIMNEEVEEEGEGRGREVRMRSIAAFQGEPQGVFWLESFYQLLTGILYHRLACTYIYTVVAS